MARRKKKKRAPPPQICDRVRLRGRKPVGWLVWINSDVCQTLGRQLNWTWVQWDDNDGPEICGLGELEKINELV